MNIREIIKETGLPVGMQPFDWAHWLGGDQNRVAFFAQAYYKWEHFGRTGYYFFMNKPEKANSFYRPRQSWRELLCLSERVLDTAMYGSDKKISPIATLIDGKFLQENGYSGHRSAVKDLLRNSLEMEHLVLIYHDKNKLSWHFVNERLLLVKLKEHKDEMARQLERAYEEYNKENNYEDNVDNVFSIYDRVNSDEGLADLFNRDLGAVGSKQKKHVNKDMYSAHKMPPEYNVSNAALLKALEMGYDQEQLGEEAERYCFSYKYGKYMNNKSSDWDGQFIHNWLTNAYSYGNIKRHGKYKDGVEKKSSTTDIIAESIGMFSHLED